jgi:hypothetical protein
LLIQGVAAGFLPQGSKFVAWFESCFILMCFFFPAPIPNTPPTPPTASQPPPRPPPRGRGHKPRCIR